MKRGIKMVNGIYDGKDDFSSMFQIDDYDGILEQSGYFIFDGAKYTDGLKNYYEGEEHTRVMIEDDEVLKLSTMKRNLDELEIPAIKEAIMHQPTEFKKLGLNYLNKIYATVFQDLNNGNTLDSDEFKSEFEALKLKKAREASKAAHEVM